MHTRAIYPDFAEPAFTNNHGFHYAGELRFETDSVIAVDFEVVPWLDKEVDITGTKYLRIDSCQLAALVVRTGVGGKPGSPPAA